MYVCTSTWVCVLNLSRGDWWNDEKRVIGKRKREGEQKVKFFIAPWNITVTTSEGWGKKEEEDLLVFILFFSSGFVYFSCGIMSNIFMKSEALCCCCCCTSGFLGSESVLFSEDFVNSGSGGVFKLFCSPQHPQLLLVSRYFFILVVLTFSSLSFLLIYKKSINFYFLINSLFAWMMMIIRK